MREATPFHVIDDPIYYHLLLGRPWTIKHKAVISMYQQCLKAIWKRNKVHISASECPFQQDEALSLKVTLSDELAEDGEVLALPQGVSLSAWVDLRK